MDLVLDGSGPRYLQLSRALKSAIGSGRLPHGSRLPPSRDLAHDIGLSRRTVVAAYELLRAEGLLKGRVGSGSYVHAPAHSQQRLVSCPASIRPQSAFAQRARMLHDPDNLTGRRHAGNRYAFDVGMPLLDGRITSAWAREVARVAPYLRPAYPMPQGHPALREALSAHITRTRGVRCEADDLLIVNGTQQAVSLAARVLVDDGDEVVFEEPQYYATRRLLQMHGAEIVGVPVDHGGLRVELLHQHRPKLIVVTPSHQFPTGAVLSQERRQALLDFARQSDAWVLEDDYDGEFRLESSAVAALQSQDKEGRVIYVGTFSKTVFPSLRLGYLIMPPALRRDFLAAKWADDFGSAPLEQRALANLIKNGTYERHLRTISRKLSGLRDLLLASLRKFCGDSVVAHPSHAGMHVLVLVPALDASNEDALIRHAGGKRLGLYAASPCYLDPPSSVALLMGYASMSAKDLVDAVKLFAECLAPFLAGDYRPEHCYGRAETERSA